MEDVVPILEEVAPTHPSLIDTEHLLAERYHIVNVPTILWIDEEGNICRPHDAQFGTDTFTAFHGKRSAPYLDMIRAWVRTGEGALGRDDVRALAPVPTRESELARVEHALAWHLSQQGQQQAAERHFTRAGDLAPLDWTIRRGSMPVRGLNPFGPEFFALAEAGQPTYPMEEVTPTRDEG
jgi:hypothetical protein